MTSRFVIPTLSPVQLRAPPLSSSTPRRLQDQAQEAQQSAAFCRINKFGSRCLTMTETEVFLLHSLNWAFYFIFLFLTTVWRLSFLVGTHELIRSFWNNEENLLDLSFCEELKWFLFFKVYHVLTTMEICLNFSLLTAVLSCFKVSSTVSREKV